MTLTHGRRYIFLAQKTAYPREYLDAEDLVEGSNTFAPGQQQLQISEDVNRVEVNQRIGNGRDGLHCFTIGSEMVTNEKYDGENDQEYRDFRDAVKSLPEIEAFLVGRNSGDQTKDEIDQK